VAHWHEVLDRTFQKLISNGTSWLVFLYCMVTHKKNTLQLHHRHLRATIPWWQSLMQQAHHDLSRSCATTSLPMAFKKLQGCANPQALSKMLAAQASWLFMRTVVMILLSYRRYW
jgi:hypothetical protein